MKILLAPSEEKIIPTQNLDFKFALDSNIATNARNENIEKYLTLLKNANELELSEIFGRKKIDLNMLSLCQNLKNAPKIRAIELYSGVAFKELDFKSLDSGQKEFILDSVIIFSNLFGAISAKDLIPFYHLNQKFAFSKFGANTFYKLLESSLDSMLENEVVIDLRAGIYQKAYKLKTNYYLPKNLDSVSSHFTKQIRGKIARQLAKNEISLEDLIKVSV